MSGNIKSKVISEKIRLTTKHWNVVQREIERDGKRFTKDFFVRRPVVMVIPFTEDGFVYIESQYRDAFQKTIFEIVAGHTEDGETDMLEAAKRELQEETGLTAASWIKMADWELGANMNAPIHLFAATDLTLGKSNQDEDEDIKTVKMPLSDLLAKIESGELIIPSNIAAVLLFERLMNTGKL